ncbi:MAG: 4Fe-4S dicluster domain-containing protein [Lachnospiraceae bacterium]|nr:4Fe-4S dicluster domain-containing protein [Lachnospiraceae bacterium]
MKYQIIGSCIGCKQCYRVCPAQAITTGPMKINPDKCTLCGKCYTSCPGRKIIQVP